MARLCARPTCGQPAAASLTYDYEARTAWVDDLTDEHHPSSYALCAHHADGLRVPNGWERSDRRGPARPLFQRSIAV
jgi:hypothetical protein